jgi:methyl-accepting chemotaxis protein
MIEASIASAHDGIGRIDLVTKTFDESARIRGDVKRQSSQIASASSEQARGIDQIAIAVQTMSEMAEGTAAQAEESAAASGELTQEAASLREMVDQLEVLVGRA